MELNPNYYITTFRTYYKLYDVTPVGFVDQLEKFVIEPIKKKKIRPWLKPTSKIWFDHGLSTKNHSKSLIWYAGPSEMEGPLEPPKFFRPTYGSVMLWYALHYLFVSLSYRKWLNTLRQKNPFLPRISLINIVVILNRSRVILVTALLFKLQTVTCLV